MSTKLDADSRQLQQTLDWHLANIKDDVELKTRLEGVAAQRAFDGMTWYWGPRLYARNRAAFRAFVMQHFSELRQVPRGQWFDLEPVPWDGDAALALDPWLAEVDRLNDVALFRRLYAWKHRDQKVRWRLDDKTWQRDVVARARAAATPAQRALALDKLDQPERLDEATAIELSAIDHALSVPFVLKHLPGRGWLKDTLWSDYMRCCADRGDHVTRMKVYRRQVPLGRWHADALALARATAQPQALCDALDAHHPEQAWQDMGKTFVALLEARGTDVMPYVTRRLADARGSWSGWFGTDSVVALSRLARKRGWVDFHIALMVKSARADQYNEALGLTLDDRTIDEAERVRRLSMFSGTSREWNWAGFGLARVQQVDEPLALKLYERFPDLVRHQFKQHIVPAWHHTHAAIFERAWGQGDDEVANQLASRYVTYGNWGGVEGAQKAIVERVADLLAALKLEPAAFARRAASILTLVPAFTIYDYNGLLKANRLARLLFERSLKDYLGDADDSGDGIAVRDLIEGSEIHVQRLAYRVLALPDERARRLARDNLDILLGTLLRPLHRETRMCALAALGNAAQADADSAARVLTRARDAFALPDKRYPKEALIALVGRILAQQPQLAGEREVRVVYRRAA